ncbi:uncharacterized protein DNG_06103 [Cephalotrichum gorgonifer]|uniref:A-kinase anchor protein 7-like phosphoesterase domain-containing protein n=1 Tax=Cephalotrichum gorgonifer TaxID=2041049 RepID=A0AAE8SW52_9PEZI|nr:uncharacterized protein DNG_06103 [Cephalotrichum gorgonifer]
MDHKGKEAVTQQAPTPTGNVSADENESNAPTPKAIPKRPPLTHFLCIPLVTPASRPELSASLGSFRREVSEANERCFRVPDGAVRPLGTLHLTLGVMSLPEVERVEEAAAVLRGLKAGDILAEKASEATVLYAPPADGDGRGVLQPFCERLRAEFLAAGLMVEDRRPLKLHATIVNTIYVRGGERGAKGKGKGGKGGKGRRKAMTLDASNLLDRYEDYVWLERFAVDRVAICKMGAKEVEPVEGEEGDGDGAAYEVVAEVEI